MKRTHEDAGFTLVELMVVVLIIGILIAIALPTFFGARARAAERSAQASIRSAHTAARMHFTQYGDYATLSPAALGVYEPSGTYNNGAAVQGEVSVRDVSASTMMLVSLSSSGEYYCIAEDMSGPTVEQGNDTADSFAVVADCTGGW